MEGDTNVEHKETILIVEDDDGIAFLQCRVLERAGYRASSVATENAALEFLAREPVDLVILDYRLPGERTGLHLYAAMKEAGHDVPVIVVTGFSDEMTVIRALRAGVRDFVSKSNDYLAYIPEAVERVLAQTRLERRLADAEARFRSFMENIPAVTFIKDHQGRIVYANQRFASLFPQAVRPEGTVGRPPSTEEAVIASDEAVTARLAELTRANGDGSRWSTHSFPIEGTDSAPLYGVVAFEV